MDKLASYLVREGPLDPPDAVGWVVRLGAALEVIHRVGVAHGRVSAKAIQILGPRCEAAGFMLDAEDLQDDVAYHSPERLDGGAPSPEDDTWAAGVVLYQALTGALPFPGTDKAQVKAEILASHAVPLASRGVRDEPLQRVIDELFAPDLAERLSSLSDLQARLIDCEPSCEGLPPLKLGKPDLEMFQREGPDEEGDQLTQVHDGSRAMRVARLLQADKPAAGADIVELDDDELDDAETAVNVDVIELAQAQQRKPPGPPPRPPKRSGPPSIPDLEPHDELPSPPPPPIEPGRAPSSPSDIFGLAEESPAPLAAPASQPAPSAPSQPALAEPVADVRSVPPPPGRKRPVWWMVGGGVVVVAGVALALAFGLGGTPGPPLGADSLSTRPSTEPSAGPDGTSRAAGTSASPPTPSSASGTATAPADAGPALTAPAAASTAAPAKPPIGDLPTCMAALFPAGTFAGANPNYGFVCTETHARKGGTAMKVEVVRAGAKPGALPEAMQEWAKLGWYEMAVFAVARARCCAEPPPLATPLGLDLCPLDKSLEQLGTAAVNGDDQAVQKAIDAYTEVAVCLVQAGASKAFGQAIAPTKIATDTFKSIVARARKSP